MLWYSGAGIHWWGAVLMAIGMAAFWALIIWGIWYLVSTMTRDDRATRPPYSAKQILDERLARGEIDEEEYRRLLELMRSEGTRSGSGHGLVGSGRT